MLNSFENVLNLGLGLIMYFSEKIEDMVEELVSKGEVAKKDARQFASELVKKGEEQREEFKNLIQEELRKGLENADIAKKEDILTSDEIRQIVRVQIQQVLYEQGVFQSEEQENE